MGCTPAFASASENTLQKSLSCEIRAEADWLMLDSMATIVQQCRSALDKSVSVAVVCLFEHRQLIYIRVRFCTPQNVRLYLRFLPAGQFSVRFAGSFSQHGPSSLDSSRTFPAGEKRHPFSLPLDGLVLFLLSRTALNFLQPTKENFSHFFLLRKGRLTTENWFLTLNCWQVSFNLIFVKNWSSGDSATFSPSSWNKQRTLLERSCSRKYCCFFIRGKQQEAREVHTGLCHRNSWVSLSTEFN